jgi:hypothetical protein
MVTQDKRDQWARASQIRMKHLESVKGLDDIDPYNPGEVYQYTPEEQQFLDSVDWSGFAEYHYEILQRISEEYLRRHGLNEELGQENQSLGRKKRRVVGPLIVMRMILGDFTTEEVALFEADDERQIREAEERRNNLTMALLLIRDRERLAELRNASNSL